MSTTSFGSSLLQTSENPRTAPGSVRTDANGGNRYIYIQNATLSDVPANRVMVVKDVGRIACQPAVGPLMRTLVQGVTLVTIPSGHYGWVQSHGTVQGVVGAGEATAPGQLVLCGDPGAIASTSTVEVYAVTLGHANENGTPGDVVSWYIRL